MSTNKFKPCVIHIGDSKALSEAVQRELFRRGYEWPTTGKHIDHDGYIIVIMGNGRRTDSNLLWTSERCNYANHRRFNAATQFGELLAYLDAPDVPRVSVSCCERVDFAFSGNVHLTLNIAREAGDSITLLREEIDALCAASQAARKEGK